MLGTRGPNGELPFGKELKAPDEWKKSSYSDGSMDEKGFSHSGIAYTRHSSIVADVRSDATSPVKSNNLNKPKLGARTLVYRRVEIPLLKAIEETILMGTPAYHPGYPLCI
jgi:hypothetical protein